MLRIKAFIAGAGEGGAGSGGTLAGRGWFYWVFPNQIPLPLMLWDGQVHKDTIWGSQWYSSAFASLKHIRAGKKDLEALPII